MNSWRSGGNEQVIGQAELAPVALSLRLWSERLRGKFVIAFIDQDAARAGMVKAYSPSVANAEIIDLVTQAAASFNVFSWFTRVASATNIADLPSRMMWAELLELIPNVIRRRLGTDAWASF